MTHSFTTPSSIIITCNKRLSSYLQQEVIELGFAPIQTFATGIEMEGTINDCIKLNLNLRCASQVLYSLKDFSCNSAEDLYKEVSLIAWERIIAADGYFSVTSNVDHPLIKTSLYANVKVKDAIVDRMRNKTGTRPNSGPALDKTVVHLFWRDEVGEIFLDTSGETLAK
ncbi:MAG: class I SAM-dependent RNA methyltransferase, partial [Segetibacter sp.]|nr:class I SAM-dependent RNA methyltransferase [Segetibacter sp.]